MSYAVVCGSDGDWKRREFDEIDEAVCYAVEDLDRGRVDVWIECPDNIVLSARIIRDVFEAIQSSEI